MGSGRGKSKAAVATESGENHALHMGAKEKLELSVVLVPAEGDPAVHTPEYQLGLREFMESLRAQDTEFNSRMHLVESTGGGGFHLGEFGILAATIVPLAGLLGAWLKAKHGRKVKLKIKDFSAEASSVEEIDELLKLAEKHLKKHRRKR
jgi:hypothetical protein